MADTKKPAGKPSSKPPSGGGEAYGDIGAWILIVLFIIFGGLSAGAFMAGVEIFFANVFWARLILWTKIITGTLSIVFTAGIIYVLAQIASSRKKEQKQSMHTEPEPQGAIYMHEWANIKSGIQSASDADAALIIIEADSLVDRVLKDMKLSGDTMGERLKALGEQKFESINDLWEAHKLRNQIAHEGAKGITYGDAVWALERYERALKKLGVI